MALCLIDISHSNIRSLSKVKLYAIRVELVFNYIIMLRESNLPHACVDDLTMHGFHEILRKDHIGRTGGGVAMYVADHVGAMRAQERACDTGS